MVMAVLFLDASNLNIFFQDNVVEIFAVFHFLFVVCFVMCGSFIVFIIPSISLAVDVWYKTGT